MIRSAGFLAVFRNNFESTLLLATLIGLVGIGAHVSSMLRGLDGFLFVVAGVVQFGASAVINYERAVVDNPPWFISHVLAFAVSGTCFLAGGAAGVAYLLINRVLRKKRVSTIVGAVAPLEALEKFGRWMLVVGFPLFTYGMLTGVCGIYHLAAPDASDRAAWFRDPFIVVSLITWLVYAYMFGSLLFRPKIRGRRAARLAAAGMALVGVVFLVAEFISPLHR